MTRALLDRRVQPIDIGSRWPQLGGQSPAPRGRRVLIGVGMTFGLLVLVAGVIGLTSGGSGRSPKSAGTKPAATPVSPSAAPSSPGGGLSWHSPATVVAVGTPAQEQYDQAFAQGLGDLPGMASSETLPVPPPAIASGWPRLAIALTPQSWAQEFVTGLLEVDYARQSRPGLGRWLVAEEAPELLPGVPASVADKVLYISVLDPSLFGGQPTPTASPAQWAEDARSGVTQSVSGILVQADPTWAQAVAAGWQPTDMRMTEEDVSGLLSVRDDRVVTTHRFAVQIIVGSARWHGGYGTVAVADWQEQ
jgi:hypothetical protein